MRIMYGARLNYKQLKRYLDYLTLSGLLHSDVRRNVFTPTDKGRSFLTCYQEVERLRGELSEKQREIHEILSVIGEPDESASPHSD
jgi:hypothetical protein